MANYMKNFTQGGWKSFISFSTQSVNNPYGAYLSARGNLEATQMKAQQKASTEATMNSGFLGVRSCAPGGRNSRGDCIEWQVDSPGKFVEAQLGWSSTSELRTLELANDIDQIVGALANLLVTKLLSSALGGVAGNSGGPASTLPPTPVPPTAQQDLLNMVSQFTASETLFRNTKQANLTTYSSTTPVYNSALACYTNYATAWNNCTGIRSAVSIATVNNAVSNITYNLNAINNITIPRFNAEISNSNNLITQLSSLQAGVIAATLASQLDTLTNNFYALQSSLHNSYHQYQAEQQTQAAQDQANDAANQQTNCSALPAACN